MTTCSFVEYRQFLLDAATLRSRGQEGSDLAQHALGKGRPGALTRVRAVQTPDSRTWTAE